MLHTINKMSGPMRKLTFCMFNKNSAEVNIAPASGKIIKNVKYRSRALGQGVSLKGMSRTITMQGFTFAATLCAEKIKLT